MIARGFASLLLVGAVVSPGFAQSVPAAKGAAAAPAEAGSAALGSEGQVVSPGAFMTIAFNISRRAAAGDAAVLYDDVSPVLKALLTREAFVRQLSEKLTGTVVERNWQSIRQFVIPPSSEKGAPQPGRYVQVVLVVGTRAEPGQSLALRVETLSFHQDADGGWRLAGYDIASAPMAAGGPSSNVQGR